MPAPSGRRLRSGLAVVGIATAMLAGLAPAAVAAPSTPAFSSTIDPLARYEGPSTCDPSEKPGVVGFRALVKDTYSGVNSGGISRSCDSGGRSEHKEGRAWDWMLRADVPADAAKADELLRWLLAADSDGNTHAMARRLGVMYIIWDRQWWSSWAPEKGWQPYTGWSPHTDHIHFSFSWDGALRRTSWWNGGTPSTGPTPAPAPTTPALPSPSPSPSPTPTAAPVARDPFGDLEQALPSAVGASPGVHAVGWAIDPDAATFTRVHLAVDGRTVTTVVADRSRPDVAADNPPYGPDHGFDAFLPAEPGQRQLCAIAENQATGADRSLGCLDVTVPQPDEAVVSGPEPITPLAPTPAPAPAPAPPAAPVPTKPGPVARATDDSCPVGRVPSAGFQDTVASPHREGVDCAVWWAVAQGTGAQTFDPDGRLSRAQIASFLARTVTAAGVELPNDPPDAFDDDDGSVHERAIDQLAAVGVLHGRSGRNYDPSAPVTRAQMAAYLVRTYEYRTSRSLPAGSDFFTDDDGSVHEPSIGKAARAGFTSGTSDTTFAPHLPTTRGQVASFLTRVLDLLVETGWAPEKL